MLPLDIKNIIFEYHDKYNLIEKKARLNFIIKRSYKNWLLDAGAYSRFFSLDEYACKLEIYPYVSSHMFITNKTCWDYFLRYFLYFEQFVYSKQRLPSIYAMS